MTKAVTIGELPPTSHAFEPLSLGGGFQEFLSGHGLLPTPLLHRHIAVGMFLDTLVS